MSFKDLGLNDEIMKAIDECGYTEPTPIQAEAIPHILMARDVVGLAQTGTGKTASFTLPMIEILAGGRAKARMPRSLILSPTRELAAQIAENFDEYGKYTQLSHALLVGGVSMDKQVQKLERGVDVLIATPGRLMDLFDRGKILLNDIKVLVIDEADRMLDMGFIPDIEKIVKLLPPMRQTLLFSATMPPPIAKLTKQFMTNPREVSVAPPASTVNTVEAFVVHVHPKDKDQTLLKLMRDEKATSAFIFCNRKRDIDGLCKFLNAKGIHSKALHGDMDQKSRTATLEQLKAGEIPFLVCSDVAGRGLDVDDLSHVFNYDVPMTADDYVHRIGRTGRAGKKGRAFMLSTNRDTKFLDAIEALIKKKITVFEVGSGGSGGGSKSGDGGGKSNKPRQHDNKSKPPHSKPKHEHESKVKAKQHEPKQHEPKQHESKQHQSKQQPKKDTRSHRDQNNNDDGGKSDKQGFGDEMPGFFK